MRTYVYVDAFNLYFGCVKGTSYRWLDLLKLSQLLLPGHKIERIKYFTARVTARPGDLSKPVRQETFLRALHCNTSESNILAKIFDHGLHGWTRLRLSAVSAQAGRAFGGQARIEWIAQDDFYPCDPCNPWSSLTAWFGCGCAALGSLRSYCPFSDHSVGKRGGSLDDTPPVSAWACWDIG